ncbi:MAG: Uma2 family endonuclease [Caldilineaceae bacterium]|nr:Uma2 family endonuclease [Caldilineaceae bacterium]
MAAVEVRTPERTLVQADANGRVRERYIDATMTRIAREARIAWRLDHLAAWQHDLEGLAHFDPDYPYDVAHEYDHDWTTDPDYGAEGVHFSEFEEDGVLIDGDSRPNRLQERMLDTARDRIGHRALTEAYYVFVPQLVEHLGLSTRQDSPVDRVRPDLLVMPTEADLQEAYKREPGRTAQLDDKVPELVLEVLSKSTATRDLVVDKRRLYGALGVVEYLVYDLGGKRWADSPRELLMWRLEDGVYRQADPDPGLSEPDAHAYLSEVFRTHIRFLPDAREEAEEFRHLPTEHRPPPHFQWYDPEESRWRDRESDERDHIAQETRQAERTDQAVATVREFLDATLSPAVLDLIETAWRRAGPPPNHLRQIKAVLHMPSEWRSLLLPDEPDDTGVSDHTPVTGPK